MTDEPVEIVFESPVDRQGFTILPNGVLMDETLSAQARMLYALLRHYARQTDSCWPNQTTLGVKLGVSSRTVRTYAAELEDACLVRRDSRGIGRSCRYVILDVLLAESRRQKGPTEKEGRKPASAADGSLFPPEVKAEEEDAEASSSRALVRLKISGKKVKPEVWIRTVSALNAFNDQTDGKLALVNGKGQPSESAKRIYGRLAEWPDITEEQVQDIIDRTLRSKWWGSDRATIGVVFGPRVFEDNMVREVPVNGNGQGRGRMSNSDRVSENIRALRQMAGK